MTEAKAALLVVDVQNDFCEGGALPLEGGAAVAARIGDYLGREYFYDFVYASQEWHSPLPDLNDGHFAAPGTEPDHATTWPAHCVADTDGAAYHPALSLPSYAIDFRKGMGRPGYSALQAKTCAYAFLHEYGRQLTLAEVLASHHVEILHIVGIAAEHSVHQSALDALAQVPQVRVLRDLCVGVAPASTAQAWTDLDARAGYRVVTTSEEIPRYRSPGG